MTGFVVQGHIYFETIFTHKIASKFQQQVPYLIKHEFWSGNTEIINNIPIKPTQIFFFHLQLWKYVFYSLQVI